MKWSLYLLLFLGSFSGATANLEPRQQGEALQKLLQLAGTPNNHVMLRDFVAQHPQESLIAQLDALLHDDQAPLEKRWLAATTLGRLGGATAEARLLEALRSPVFMVRMAAIKGIELLANRENLPRLLPPMHASLADKAMVVRAAVADALATWRQRDSLPFLEIELRKPHNYYRGRSLWVREHMIHAIGMIGGEQSVRILLSCLHEQDPRISAAVWAALNPLYTLPGNTMHSETEKQAWLVWQAESTRIGPPPPEATASVPGAAALK